MPGPIPDAIGHARIARRRSWVWACLRLIGLAVTYGAVGKLSLGLAFANSNVTAVWPPTGIAVAALMLWGLRLWPGVAVGAFLANVLNGAGAETSALIAIGNTIAPVLAVVLVRLSLRRSEITMQRLPDVGALMGVGGLACMAVSATLGTAALVVSGALPAHLYATVWPTWWIGDAMGVVLVAPALLVLAESLRGVSISRMRAVEGALLLMLEFVVSVGVFSANAPVAFLIFPLVIWISVRLHLPGAASSVSVVAAVSIFQTVHGSGPFASHDVNSALIGLQAFNGAVALTAFLLAALAHRDTVAVTRLETQVAARTADLVERTRRLSIITQAGRDLRQLLEPSKVLDQLAFLAVELASSSDRTTGRSTLTYIENDSSSARVHADRDSSGMTLRGLTFAVSDHPPINEVVRTHRSVRAAIQPENYGPALRPVMEGLPFTEAVYSPIIVDGEVFAILTLGARGHQVDDADIKDLQALGEIGGLAVTNAQSYQAAVRARDELMAQAAELARSNGELEQFASVASHDLQEPLRTITSYVQLLARRYRGALGEDGDEYISFVVDGALRMQELIEDLLAYSRAGHAPDELDSIDAGTCVDAATSNLLSSVRASAGEVVHVDLPHVRANATQLTQVFQNLIGNALKFHGEVPPRVEVAASRQREFWVFSVSDNGIGIDPSQRDRVLQVFQRLHTRHEYPGTGIGLALCKRVVEGFGGRIWLEPQNGGGSRFQFTVPAGDGPDTASGAAAANTASPSAHPVMASTGASRARP